MKHRGCAFVFVLTGALLPLVCGAGVKARYVRVDNPSGLVFRCRQLEVYSGGKNIVLNHPEWVTGTTHPLPSNKEPDRLNTIISTAESRACRDVVNGDTNVTSGSEEWITWHAPGAAYEWGPWFEIDLQEEVEVDKVVFYGSMWPRSFYVDKGHRTICTMDANRVVNWGVQFQYHDKANFPDGIFAFPVEKKTKAELQVVGTKIPPRALDWVPMDWILKADREIVPPDAEARMARFARRNSPAEVKKFADDFFAILDESTPGLEGAFKAYRAGEHLKALEAWKVYWFAKMRRVNQHQALNHNKAYSAAGDDLLKGLMVTIMSNEARAIRYTPGRISWIIVPEDKNAPDFNKQLKEALADGERKAGVGSVSWPLLYSYRVNPDPKYIERWAEIMDDWALNFFVDSAKVPYEVENLFTFNPAHTWCQMMEDLDNIAREQPGLVQAMPAITLARAQMIALEKYTTAWWRQARETVFNHNTGGYYAFEPILFYIDEFHPGKRTAKEWHENIVRWLVLGNFRDGSMTEIGDEGHMEIPTLMNVIAKRLESYKEKPEWYTPGWKNHFFEWADNMMIYMYRHLAPGGYEHRDRPDYRTYRWLSTTAPYWKGRPTTAMDRDAQVLGLPEMRRMLNVWGFLSVPLPEPNPPVFSKEIIDSKWRPVQKAMQERWGAAAPAKPQMTSDWMPYYGGYYFRGGWELDDPFVHMVASGADGGGHPFLYPYTMCYLYDHNFPLIAADPVRVKNYLPLQIHGMEHRYNPGTKVTFLTGADENPADYRWLSTDRLDYGEALHHGAYGNLPNMRGNWDDTSLEMQPLPERVTGIKTARQIIHLRKPRLFLIIDRVQGNTDGHEISIMYKPALAAKKGADFDTAKQLTLTPLEADNAPKPAGAIRTDNPGAPSLTMHQFADQPFCYRLERDAKPEGRYACRLGGDTLIAEPTVRMITKADRLTTVSLWASREPGGKDRIAAIQPTKPDASSVGFQAKMADGTEIACRIAKGSKPEKFSGDIITATADMLVTVTPPNEPSYGFLLGTEALTVSGRNTTFKTPDFEFTLRNGRLDTTPIHRPIKPVTFEPNRTTFTGTETVTMKSDTPNVEIRYTTDGTPPTRTSTLYKGPVKISKTTEIAARAYRLAPDGKPYPPVAEDFELNGTRFTVPSYAFYRQRDPAPPAPVAKAALKPGLAYEYLEAPWWRLYASAHWLPAQKSGTAPRELDLTSVNTTVAYCMRYKGYLDIPADGTYTFHAPEERTKMIGSPSYDLRLYINGEEWALSQFWHGHGTWSIPLKKGLHEFQVDFADARTKPWNRSGIWRFYPRPWTEHVGDPSPILLSGPGLPTPARIPQDRLFHKP
ncbi:MAG: chitobiase/beta-hexosaminidase C-terminal domain-containing protein [Kiritimatiellaeota bacterium]|nr:chitobiase/beta-hexosaminidase C-terminal domain-containing protein [Kiritimatiellota bacterium]